ncbi:hypothetical protein I4U23_010799 [Adineta vaga]|nr:hypothetical protein I4U23_010799 [Adineta vaga]
MTSINILGASFLVTLTAFVMSLDGGKTYAQEVAEEGKKTFNNIFSYTGGDCVNLHHGDGALPPHPVCVSNVGDNVHLVRPKSDGQITAEHIQKALDEHPETRAIFLINPNNPTGQYFTKDELEKIGRLAVERQLIVIVDEIMYRLILDHNSTFVSMASIDIDGTSMIDRTITFRGLSKDHGLASLRSGYAIGTKELIEKLNFTSFLFLTTCNVDILAQHVTIAALSRTPDEYYQAQRDLLRRHIDIVTTSVDDINRRAGHEALKTERPPAGMFQIIDAISLRGQFYNGKILDNDATLCKLLLEEEMGGVSFLPASIGGYDAKDMKFRLTLSSIENDIILGMKRLDDFIQKVSHAH